MAKTINGDNSDVAKAVIHRHVVSLAESSTWFGRVAFTDDQRIRPMHGMRVSTEGSVELFADAGVSGA